MDAGKRYDNDHLFNHVLNPLIISNWETFPNNSKAIFSEDFRRNVPPVLIT